MYLNNVQELNWTIIISKKKHGGDKYSCNMFSLKTNWKILTCL